MHTMYARLKPHHDKTCPNLDTGPSSFAHTLCSTCLLFFNVWHHTPRSICGSPTVPCEALTPPMTPILQQPFSGMFLFWTGTIGWRFPTLVPAPKRFSAFAIPVSGDS